MTIPQAKKKGKLSGNDNEEFTIIIRGRENYEILSKLRDSLEMAALVPKDFFQTIQKGGVNGNSSNCVTPGTSGSKSR